MCREPILWMLIAMAVSAQVLLYFGFMFHIGMTFKACDLIVSDMVLMNEIEVIVFVHSLFDIVTGIALGLRDNIICAS